MGVPMYWLALERMPKSILNRLRQCSLSFLWWSHSTKQKIHLADWHTLLRPYSWNIKNIEWFSISLRLKSLWSVLKSRGSWNKVIQVKYLKETPMDCCMRRHSFSVQRKSHIWNGFIRILVWSMGNGNMIKLGIDPIAGLNISFTLSEDLRANILDYSIGFLSWARN